MGGKQEAKIRMHKDFGKYLGLSVAVTLSFAAMQGAIAAEDPSKQLAKADALMQSGKAQAAADLLREIIRSNPDNSQAHMQLGASLAALAEKDDYDTAILEEKQALKLDPKSFGARIILGHIYANQNKSNESINILKEAVELKPTSYGAHRDLGIAYMASGKGDEAMTELKKAIEIKPKGCDAHMKLALLLSTSRNYRDALNEAMQAVQLASKDSEQIDSQLTLGNILVDSGNASDSIPPFKSVLAKAKGHPVAMSGYGWAVAEKEGKVDEGIACQRKAIKDYPIFMPAYVRLAELLVKKNDLSGAEEQYKAALKVSPDDERVRTAYAKFLEGQQRKDEAKTELKKVLEKKPNYAPASEALSALDKKSK